MSIAVLPQQSRLSSSPAMGSGTPSKLDERRVLGDLSPNSKIVSKTSTVADFRSSKALFEAEHKTLQLFPSVELSTAADASRQPSPMRIGQKRRIDQVDGYVECPVQGVKNVRDRAEDEIKSAQSSDPQAPPCSPSVSSTTDEADAPDEEDLPRPKLGSQDSSVTQASFSSLIDYNPHSASSQQEKGHEIADTEDAEATLAKTTNQINVPLSRLQLRSSPATTQPNTPTQSSPGMMPSPAKSSRWGSIHEPQSSSKVSHASIRMQTPTPKPSAISPILGSPLRIASSGKTSDIRETNGTELGPSTGSRNMSRILSGPVLRPTAYSSRFIEAPSEPKMENTTKDVSQHSRSSSSVSYGSRTEVASSTGSSSEALQSQSASSGVGQADPAVSTADLLLKPVQDFEMTNGEDTAVNGLLELMHANVSGTAS
ncbi:hypothetical protein EV356DRAFT_520584 [Viridothelium virens]|uniref:Uncharacterized protein n=1 Tax=Viridothelium virens TaxID=1048519 RepID=A0A6A6GWE0_VIRVR|nr:hypothetical protein EV356DRAFT_520584 [Viridothelium virens]